MKEGAVLVEGPDGAKVYITFLPEKEILVEIPPLYSVKTHVLASNQSLEDQMVLLARFLCHDKLTFVSTGE